MATSLHYLHKETCSQILFWAGNILENRNHKGNVNNIIKSYSKHDVCFLFVQEILSIDYNN
jgi:hypothetical protein